MRCVNCKQGEPVPGTTIVTLTRERMTLVFRGVPARVCDVCGEAYVDEAVSTQLLEAAEAVARAGAQVKVREYVAASQN